MNTEIASQSDREKLAFLRAPLWKAGLTTEQYVERNKHLYRHPYGKEKITTYVLKDSAGNLLMSMDALQIGILDRDEIATNEGYLIASVLTPENERGKGHASKVLEDFFNKEKETHSVLYSDISPSFYERYGFAVRPMLGVEEPLVFTEKIPSAVPVSLGVFSSKLKISRIEGLRKQTGAAGSVEPEPGFIDWHIERFRVFATIAKKKLPEHLFWEVSHGTGNHLLAAVPHFLYGRMEALWIEADCKECISFLSELARKNSLDKVYFWTEHLTRGKGRTEQPMIRIPGQGPALFFNPQYMDSW